MRHNISYHTIPITPYHTISITPYHTIPYTRKNEQLDQCCQQLVVMLCCILSTTLCCTLSTTVVNNHCSQLFTFNNHCSIIVDNHRQACLSTIVGSCSNNIVAIIVLCQHRTTIDRTMLINIVNSTSVVEP